LGSDLVTEKKEEKGKKEGAVGAFIFLEKRDPEAEVAKVG